MSGKPAASARVVARLPRTSLGYDLLVVLGSPLGVLTATGEEDQMPPEVPSSPDCQAPSNDLLFSSKFASCIYLSILFFGICCSQEQKTIPNQGLRALHTAKLSGLDVDYIGPNFCK